MPLTQTVFEPALKVYEEVNLQLRLNGTIPATAPIAFLKVEWDEAQIPQYQDDDGNELGTICYALRWRINGGSWNPEPIVAGATTSNPILPSFSGLVFSHEYIPFDVNPSANGLSTEIWKISGTPNVAGVIEIQFSINPNDLSNPFGGV